MTGHARIPTRLLAVATALILAIGVLAGGLASAAGPTIGLGTATTNTADFAQVPAWVFLLLLAAVVPLTVLFRSQDQRLHDLREV